MRRTLVLSTVAVIALLVLPVAAQQPVPRRPSAPMLTNEDVLSPGTTKSLPEESISRSNVSAIPLRNPRAVLESALTKMGEVTSVRTRLQTAMREGESEILIESMKPDRMRVKTPYGEMIAIGGKIYVKSAKGWEVSSAPAGSAKSDAAFDFRAFVKEMMVKPGVRIVGQALGTQTLDGVETLAYEFAVTDGAETGTIQLCVGKQDGYMRGMFVSGATTNLKIWFTNINEHISIEPPM